MVNWSMSAAIDQTPIDLSPHRAESFIDQMPCATVSYRVPGATRALYLVHIGAWAHAVDCHPGCPVL